MIYLLFLQITTPKNIRNIKKGAVTMAPHIPPIIGPRLCLSGIMVARGVIVRFIILDATILVHVSI